MSCHPSPSLVPTVLNDLPEPLPIDFTALFSTSSSPASVDVRAPNPQEFFRIDPCSDSVLDTCLYHYDYDNTYFLVTKDLRRSALQEHLKPVRLHLCINRFGEFFFWPIPVATRPNSWSRSREHVRDEAKLAWVRMVREGKGYRIVKAQGAKTDVEWPSYNFNDLLTAAFTNRVIDSLDHPVVKWLLGRS